MKEIDNRVEIGSLSLAKSQGYHGSVIYWDKKKSDFWVMIGDDGLTMCGSPMNIYSVVGVDEVWNYI